jgi:hypothetical protein
MTVQRVARCEVWKRGPCPSYSGPVMHAYKCDYWEDGKMETPENATRQFRLFATPRCNEIVLSCGRDQKHAASRRWPAKCFLLLCTGRACGATRLGRGFRGTGPGKELLQSDQSLVTGTLAPGQPHVRVWARLERIESKQRLFQERLLPLYWFDGSSTEQHFWHKRRSRARRTCQPAQIANHIVKSAFLTGLDRYRHCIPLLYYYCCSHLDLVCEVEHLGVAKRSADTNHFRFLMANITPPRGGQFLRNHLQGLHNYRPIRINKALRSYLILVLPVCRMLGMCQKRLYKAVRNSHAHQPASQCTSCSDT